MIPPDVASQIKLNVQPERQERLPTQPVAATQKIADVLNDLTPGQRLFAEIQSLLPNGSYRAMVGQREITLALPFSAKPGDSLELEVTETNGKMALAFVANRSEVGADGKASVATSLSPTGQLIKNLLTGLDTEGKRAPAAALNGNQPIMASMPGSGPEIASALRQSLTQSGVFYEAHQARWVAGQLPTEALRQEPQGRQLPLAGRGGEAAGATPAAANAGRAETTGAAQAATQTPAPAAPAGTPPGMPAGVMPRELAALVQQQLDGLAAQNYVWQGEAWPGQKMHWEIGEDGARQAGEADDGAKRWQTRLKLAMPMLGGIEAELRLQPGGQVALALKTDTANSEKTLRQAGDGLLRQMAAAGLELTQMRVTHESPAD